LYYFNATQDRPLRLSIFYRFFMLLFRAISDAFELLTAMSSSRTLLLGKGRIFC
jgi:hypothetical protein